MKTKKLHVNMRKHAFLKKKRIYILQTKLISVINKIKFLITGCIHIKAEFYTKSAIISETKNPNFFYKNNTNYKNSHLGKHFLPH